MASKIVFFAIANLFFVFVTSVPISPPEVEDGGSVSVDQRVLPFQRSEAGIFAPEDDFITYRLPNNSLPLRYDLWLKTDVDKEEFDFSGRVKIHIKITNPTQTIILHARQLTINQVDLLRVSDNVVLSPSLQNTYNDFYEFLIITLPALQNRDDEILLDIQYTGNLRQDGSGFYRASYTDSQGNRVWFATTQFEMTDARHAMPCFDEPGIRAVTGLQIQHDKRYNAISNMQLIGVPEPIPSTDYVTSKFEDTPKMQSYLLAFVISDYTYVSNNDPTVEQRVYAKPQSIAEGRADYTRDIVGPVLWKLEDVLKINFPLKKMDHALIFDYIWGAMENFGLITYQERSMLYLKGVDAVSREYGINTLVAHEYAHQWFGNIVSPSWWAYTWLNEGFATLFANYIPSLIFPEDGYMERFRTGAMATAFSVDVSNSVPLNYYVETPINIRNKFDSISYQKGGTFLRMMMEALTPNTFIKGLNYYLNEMYFQAATPQDLHRNLQKAYDEDFLGNTLSVDAVMRTWEEQAGYPTIHVEKNGNALSFTQKRFGGGSQIYSVPISFATLSSPTFDLKTPKLWLTTSTGSISGIPTNDWVVLNVQQTGYYKVSYGKNAWDALSRGLSSNHIGMPSLHRMLLFSDMLAQLQETSVEVYQALELFSYLGVETESSVLNQANNVESFLANKIFGTLVTSEYQLFIQSITEPHLTRLGFDEINGEPAADVAIRNWAKTLSCKSFQQSCLNYELERLKIFVNTGSGSYNLCNGLRLADTTLFERVIALMLASTGTARSSYINDMGCVLDKDLVLTYLATVLNTENSLTAAERGNILKNTLGLSTVALDRTLDFVAAFYETIELNSPGDVKNILSRSVSYINTAGHYEKFRDIMTHALEKSYLTSAEADVMTSSIALNLQWESSNLWKIEFWLKGEAITDEPPTTDSTSSSTTTAISTTIADSTTTTTAVTSTSSSTTTTKPNDEATTLGSASLVASMTAVILCALVKYFI